MGRSRTGMLTGQSHLHRHGFPAVPHRFQGRFGVWLLDDLVQVGDELEHGQGLLLGHTSATDPVFTVPAAYLTLKLSVLPASFNQNEICDAIRSASAGAVAGP